jgi:hypothetical protein
MIDERDMPSMQPPRHELAAMADEIMAGVVTLEAQDARRLRNRIMAALIYVRHEAARTWLGSALTRGRGDD